MIRDPRLWKIRGENVAFTTRYGLDLKLIRNRYSLTFFLNFNSAFKFGANYNTCGNRVQSLIYFKNSTLRGLHINIPLRRRLTSLHSTSVSTFYTIISCFFLNLKEWINQLDSILIHAHFTRAIKKQSPIKISNHVRILNLKGKSYSYVFVINH